MTFNVLFWLLMTAYCNCSCDDLQLAECWGVSMIEEIQQDMFHRLRILFHPCCTKPNQSIELEIKIQDSITNQYLPFTKTIRCILQVGQPCDQWISTDNILKSSKNYTVDIGPQNCPSWRSKDKQIQVPMEKKLLNFNETTASDVMAITITVAIVISLTVTVATVVVCRRKRWYRSRNGCYICVPESVDDPPISNNPCNNLTLSNLQRIFVASFPLPFTDMDKEIEKFINMLKCKYTRTTNLRSNDLNLLLTIETQLKHSDHIILLVTDRLLDLWTISQVSINGTHDHQMIYMLKQLEIVTNKPLHVVDFTSTVEHKASLKKKLHSQGIRVCYDCRLRASDFTLLLEQLSKNV